MSDFNTFAPFFREYFPELSNVAVHWLERGVVKPANRKLLKTNWKHHEPKGNLLATVKGEPELTDPFNLLINVKLRMLWNWNFFYLKKHFYGNIVS